jgi:hypothetical protein
MDHPCVDVVLEETTGAGLTYLAPRGPIQLLKLVFTVVQYLTTGRGLLSSNVSAFADTVTVGLNNLTETIVG